MLVDQVGTDAAAWLADEDIFEALGRLHPELRLISASDVELATRSDDCAVDAFYLPEALGGPCVVYRADVNRQRLRFTLLHELGHHLLETVAAELHDSIDQCAGPKGDCQAVEESVCQAFAGRVLIPDDLAASVLDGDQLRPRHVVEMYERSEASWMAVAVRLAEVEPTCSAIILMTERGRVRFVAPSRSAFSTWRTWRAGSAVQPNGPLATAFDRNAHSQAEIYRWGVGYPHAGFCDTLLTDEGLVIAVIGDKRSDGQFALLDEVAPSYVDRERWCAHCNEERTEGWCDLCSDRHCHQCGRCGCAPPPISNPRCNSCGLHEPHRAGATMCVTCEANYP
jgi:Zn-dependent peptidase ImmA (M78 family)